MDTKLELIREAENAIAVCALQMGEFLRKLNNDQIENVTTALRLAAALQTPIYDHAYKHNLNKLNVALKYKVEDALDTTTLNIIKLEHAILKHDDLPGVKAEFPSLVRAKNRGLITDNEYLDRLKDIYLNILTAAAKVEAVRRLNDMLE